MTSNTSAVIPIIAKEGQFNLDHVQLGKTVIRIRKMDEKFELIFDDGEVICSNYVISTVPISQYNHEKLKIDFMTEEKLKLIRSIPFVHFANCWVLLDEADEKSLDSDMFIYIPTRYTMGQSMSVF